MMSYPGSRGIEYWAWLSKFEQIVRGIEEFEEFSDKFSRMCARDDRRHDNGQPPPAVEEGSEDVDANEPSFLESMD